MNELLKKTIHAAIGATTTTKEKLEESLDSFVKKGKITLDEKRELIDEIIHKGEADIESRKEKLGDIFEAWLKKAKLATKSDLEALTARIEALEKALEKDDSDSE